MAERDISKTMAKRLRRSRRQHHLDEYQMAIVRRRVRMGEPLEKAIMVVKDKNK